MKKSLSKLALSAGAAALIFAPVSASAGTRAGDSSTVYQVTDAAPGLERDGEGEHVAGGIEAAHVILAILIGGWATVFVSKSSDLLFDDDEDEFQSAGV